MHPSISVLVRPHLPCLRRFSRALNGSREQGDAGVVRLLEALIADQRRFRLDVPPKIALYQLYIELWAETPTEFNDQGIGLEDWADRRLRFLEPRPRQAFLLAAVEELTTDEIATVLQTTHAEVRRLIRRARAYWMSWQSNVSSLPAQSSLRAFSSRPR
jgi:hypothetical protein